MSPLYNPVVLPGVRAAQPAVGEYLAPAGSSTSTSQLTASGTIYWVPIDVAVPCNVDALALNVSTAGAGTGLVLRLGVRSDDGAGRPGALVVDAGTADPTSTGDKVVTFTARRLAPGRYWAGAGAQGTVTTGPIVITSAIANQQGLAALGSVSHRAWAQSGVSGAFAAAGGTVVRTGASPNVCIRVSA